MCGLCGVRKFGQVPIDQAMVDTLLLGNEHRGISATGVALQQEDGSIQVYKIDEPAWAFVASNEYKEFMKKNLRPTTLTVLGHTRAATVGEPEKNENNHPMWHGKTAVTHNGTIQNHTNAFDRYKLERHAETDSDIIRAILDEDGLTPKALNKMNSLTGNAAFVAVSTAYPGKLLLARSGNPIQLAATEDYLIWSSETGPIYKALRPNAMRFGVPMRRMSPLDHYMVPMNDHSAWLFGNKPKGADIGTWEDDWLEWHQEMKISYNFTPVNYQVHANYHGLRLKFYQDKKVDVVQCPKCQVWISLSPTLVKQLHNLKCAACKTKLA